MTQFDDLSMETNGSVQEFESENEDEYAQFVPTAESVHVDGERYAFQNGVDRSIRIRGDENFKLHNNIDAENANSGRQNGFYYEIAFILFIFFVILPVLILTHGKAPAGYMAEFSSDKTVIPIALREGYGADIDRYHIVLMYEQLKLSNICTAESLLRALLKGYKEKRYDKPAEVWVWLSHLDQQLETFSKIEKYVKDNKGERDIKLLHKRIDFNELISGTPLDFFYSNRTQHELGRYGNQNKGNAARLAIVQKYGGFYIDADILFANDPTILSDGLAQQGLGVYNNAAFKFSKPNHPLLNILIQDFIENYEGSKWGFQGPLLFSRVIKKKLKCTVIENDAEQDVVNRIHCPSIDAEIDTIMTRWNINQVYPLPWYSGAHMRSSFASMVSKYKLDFENPSKTLMIHLWHKHSHRGEQTMCLKPNGYERYKESFIGALKQRYCPFVTEGVFALKENETGYCEF